MMWPLFDAQEWGEKLRRGSASGITRPAVWLDEVDARATEDCLDGARYGPYYENYDRAESSG